ncbi:MAG: hypothetical protein ACLQNE_03580 [Thermoguttaceae bacterium]
MAATTGARTCGWTVPETRRRRTGQTAHGGKVKPPVDVETGIQQLVTTGILWANRSTL